MSLNRYVEQMLPEIETELRSQIDRLNEPHTLLFQDMLSYHMGWTGEGAGPQAAGKRIRPLMLLLVAASCGVDWRSALPAAASVELVHNFSLVHDDVQDNSDRRRGRPTVWAKWGVPMAINVGDALFVISNQAIMDLANSFAATSVVRAAVILHDTCLNLTRGQFLDMSYEGRPDLTIDDYWPMIAGKTSALLSACTHIGAVLGNISQDEQESYRSFGHHLGLAFQIQDDILGIWGDDAVTGKSAASDLLERKNSLPVLYALGKGGDFARRWAGGPIGPEEVNSLALMLEAEGAREHAWALSQRETGTALEFLDGAHPGGEAGEALLELANQLLQRKH